MGRINDFIRRHRIARLINKLSDEKDSVRRDAEETLKKIGEPAVPALIDALKDENFYVRWDVAKLLGRIGDARAVPALINALEEDNKRVVRLAAVRVLGNMGDARAVPSLIKALKYVNAEAREDVSGALDKIISDSSETHLREMGRLLRKALGKAEGREEKKDLFDLLDRVNIRKNALLAPEVKKLKPPKILKRRKKPKRRIWRAVQ